MINRLRFIFTIFMIVFVLPMLIHTLFNFTEFQCFIIYMLLQIGVDVGYTNYDTFRVILFSGLVINILHCIYCLINFLFLIFGEDFKSWAYTQTPTKD